MFAAMQRRELEKTNPSAAGGGGGGGGGARASEMTEAQRLEIEQLERQKQKV